MSYSEHRTHYGQRIFVNIIINDILHWLLYYIISVHVNFRLSEYIHVVPIETEIRIHKILKQY